MSRFNPSVNTKALDDKIGVLQGIDNYSTVLTKDENGNVEKIEVKDGEITIQTTNIDRDANGNVASVTEIINGKTVTTTLNRSVDDSISSAIKVVG
ncbi:hypothetical protein [Priestia aryabhattai]|uniref:hypothetical protein n=1 Tax=Priestia aryabhattai TaxID=412384 RepID=UPI002E1A7C1B|nr:hypothetical protein [Priestia aryabhattai]MED4262172.1 hypothetical protein [Priestia aryabhattai]